MFWKITVISLVVGIFVGLIFPEIANKFKSDRSRELALIRTCNVLRYDYRTHEGIYNCSGVIIVSDVVKGF